MLPAAIGLPLSALHLGRPFLALTAMKNIKTSWLSREALALGVFTAFMNIIVILYFLDISQSMRLFVEFITLIVGVFGIYAQSMIYRIKARPSWDRITTNLKFFGVSYIGAFILAFVALLFDLASIALPLLSLGMIGVIAQIFFTYEDLRTLKTTKENEYQLLRTAKLYDNNFKIIKQFRYASILFSGLFLPLVINILISSSILGGACIVLAITIILMILK